MENPRLGFFTSVLFAFLLSGCSSLYKPIRIDNLGQTLAQIRQSALAALPVGLMSTSPNGREVQSKYFVASSKGDFKEAIQNPVRYTAKITINGERRPYQVEILVLKEEREGSSSGNHPSYHVSGQDLRLASLVKMRFQQELAKRREDVNIIDDFRVF